MNKLLCLAGTKPVESAFMWSFEQKYQLPGLNVCAECVLCWVINLLIIDGKNMQLINRANTSVEFVACFVLKFNIELAADDIWIEISLYEW